MDKRKPAPRRSFPLISAGLCGLIALWDIFKLQRLEKLWSEIGYDLAKTVAYRERMISLVTAVIMLVIGLIAAMMFGGKHSRTARRGRIIYSAVNIVISLILLIYSAGVLSVAAAYANVLLNYVFIACSLKPPNSPPKARLTARGRLRSVAFPLTVTAAELIHLFFKAVFPTFGVVRDELVMTDAYLAAAGAFSIYAVLLLDMDIGRLLRRRLLLILIDIPLLMLGAVVLSAMNSIAAAVVLIAFFNAVYLFCLTEELSERILLLITDPVLHFTAYICLAQSFGNVW